MKPKGGLLIELDGPEEPVKGPMAGEEDPDADMDAEFQDAASAAFDALQEGDVEGFAAALKSAVAACGY